MDVYPEFTALLCEWLYVISECTEYPHYVRIFHDTMCRQTLTMI